MSSERRSKTPVKPKLIRMPEATLRALQAIAKRNHRSVQGQILLYVDKGLAAEKAA